MNPCIGEIRVFAGNYAPQGWNMCDGTLLSIANNTALYTLIGNTYGGDGQTTFAVPDLRGRQLISQGTGLGLTARVIGTASGSEGVTLNTTQIPAHTHNVMASTSDGNANTPTGGYLAGGVDTTNTNVVVNHYIPTATSNTIVPLDGSTISPAGQSLAHENRMPFVTISYIICMAGIFPSFN